MSRRPTLAPDVLAVDVGNSKVHAVLFLDAKERFGCRVEYDSARRWGDAWSAALRVVRGLASTRVPVVVSSVAPGRARVVENALRRAGLRRVHRAGWRDRWPFALALRSPQTTGVDRLANVAGLMALGLKTGIAVDVGTAITVDVLQRGCLRGGLILPGFRLMSEALHAHTAQLPIVEPAGVAAPLVGRDTRSAVTAGIQSTLLRGVDGILDALRAQFGRGTAVVLTGGQADRLAAGLRAPFARIEPDLLIVGLRLLCARRRRAAKRR